MEIAISVVKKSCDFVNPFPAIHNNTTIVICSAFCLCTLVAYIANNMNPDQTAPSGAVWSGFIVFASVIKLVWSTFECMQQMQKTDDSLWKKKY